jgi:WD40 repeat protein
VKNNSDDEDEITENIEEKKLRQAKQYVDKIIAFEAERNDDSNKNSDPVAQKLKKEALRAQKKIPKNLASKLSKLTISTTELRGHKNAPTCIALHNNTAYTGGKDKCIISWDLESGKKNRIIKAAHTDHVTISCILLT